MSSSLFFKLGLANALSAEYYTHDANSNTYTFSCYNDITTYADILSHLSSFSVCSKNNVLENSTKLIIGYINISDHELERLLKNNISCLRKIIEPNVFCVTHANIKEMELVVLDVFGDYISTKLFKAIGQLDIQPL